MAPMNDGSTRAIRQGPSPYLIGSPRACNAGQCFPLFHVLPPAPLSPFLPPSACIPDRFEEDPSRPIALDTRHPPPPRGGFRASSRASFRRGSGATEEANLCRDVPDHIVLMDRYCNDRRGPRSAKSRAPPRGGKIHAAPTRASLSCTEMHFLHAAAFISIATTPPRRRASSRAPNDLIKESRLRQTERKRVRERERPKGLSLAD